MERKLPTGWVETELGDLYNFVGGGTPSKSVLAYWNGKTPWASIKDISKNEVLIETQDSISIEGLNNSAANVAEIGEVIMGARLLPGKAVLTNIRTAINQDLKIVRPIINISSRFTYYQFRFRKSTIEELSFGTTVKGVTIEKLRGVKFFLPPLPEQERIVAKLDKLFAQHEKIKKALDHIPQLLRDFRQQVLTQAVTGKLTGKWREGKELKVKVEKSNNRFRSWVFPLPDEWLTTAFGDIANVKSNLIDPNLYFDYLLIAPDNIEPHTGRLISSPLVSEIRPKSGKHLFEKGSIVYSKIRPYLNKLIIADFKGLCSADMYPILNTIYTETKFIFYYMLSKEFLSYSTTAGERSVLPKINQNGLNEIPFPLPTLQEQQEIVLRIESLFSKADIIEARYRDLKKKVDELPHAILHKAFKGELVPQLPTDGDAKELLEEVLALKKESKGKRGKR